MNEEAIEISEKETKSNSRMTKERILRKWKSLGKWRWVIIVLTLTLLAMGGVWALTRQEEFSIPKNNSNDIPIDVSEPEKIISQSLPLTGELVSQEEYDNVNKYLPMAVMIENLSSIRPVSGLARADLVFEAIVEGGITRYMAIFHSKEAEEIMPVRSSRAYYLDWLTPLDVTYMHIGGAVSSNPLANAIPRIAQEGIKSLSNVYGSWWRRQDRVAPHNAFTSTERMKNAQVSLGWSRKPEIQLWQFKDDAEKETITTTEQFINVNWGTRGPNEYSVRWVYNPIDNNYIYEVGGVRQTDPVTKDDLTAKNVIVQFERVSPANDGTVRVVYETKGSGRALIFQDGKVIEGTWKKPDLATRDRYYDAESHEVQFNRGRSWVMVVPTESQVTF